MQVYTLLINKLKWSNLRWCSRFYIKYTCCLHIRTLVLKIDKNFMLILSFFVNVFSIESRATNDIKTVDVVSINFLFSSYWSIITSWGRFSYICLYIFYSFGNWIWVEYGSTGFFLYISFSVLLNIYVIMFTASKINQVNLFEVTKTFNVE